MLQEEKGFKSPWKAPSLPRAKNALLVLLTLSVTVLGRKVRVPPYSKTLGGVGSGDTGVGNLDDSCFVSVGRNFHGLKL